MINGIANFRASNTSLLPKTNTQQDIISAQPAQETNTMEIKPEVGVLTPPNTIPKHSFVQEQQDMLQMQNGATPIATQRISDPQQQKNPNTLLKLLLWGGGIAAAVLLLKKFKPIKIDRRGTEHRTLDDYMKTGQAIWDDISKKNCVTLEQLNAHKEALIANSGRARLKDYNLQDAFIRLRDGATDETQKVLQTVRDVACEARNVIGMSPKVSILVKEGSDAAASAMAEAFKTGSISTLPKDILQQAESISIQYIKTPNKYGDILVETKVGQIIDNIAKNGSGRIANFFSRLWQSM